MGLNIGSHWIPLNINISGETSRRSPLGEHGGHGAPHRTCQPTISRRRGESGVRWHSRVYINIDREIEIEIEIEIESQIEIDYRYR